MSKNTICRLYVDSICEAGICENKFSLLSQDQKKMLEKIGSTYFLKSNYRTQIKVVMSGGVFDIIHPGHILTLTKAKSLGDVLVVAVASDQTVLKTKNREALHSQIERMQMVNSLKPVDLAIAGGDDWLKTLNLVSPNIVVFGYDQKVKDIDGVQCIKLDTFVSNKNSKTGKVRDIFGI
jgi:cytidyltransferase-like protein